MQAMQSDICQPYLELLIPHSVQLSAAAQEADLRAALAKSYAVGTMYTLLSLWLFMELAVECTSPFQIMSAVDLLAAMHALGRVL